jgi:hypothetical protein
LIVSSAAVAAAEPLRLRSRIMEDEKEEKEEVLPGSMPLRCSGEEVAAEGAPGAAVGAGGFGCDVGGDVFASAGGAAGF